MSREFPDYYSELGPFRAAFADGTPILTYHKLGPRPRRTRLKGMYLSEALFARQMEELRAAGFVNGSLSDFAPAPVKVSGTGSRPERRIVITFDDGYANVLRHGVGPLAGAGLKAIQFIVAGMLGQRNEWDMADGEAPEPLMDAAQVTDWLASGHDIGSHSMTHARLGALSPADAREEITASRKKLEDLFGRPVEHFCYPYGNCNETIRDLVAAAGYKTASTTDAGMNAAGDTPFALKRFTARYPSRNMKAIWARLRR